MTQNIQYISDENGKTTGVIVPIHLWHEISSATETSYLLNSDSMKKRLLESIKRKDGVSFKVAREKLGI